MKYPLKLFITTLFVWVSGLGSGAFAADEWPTKQIKVIVPFDAGAGTDIVQRFYAQQLSKALGQQIIVENVGGAGGAIGTMRVARSPADGYTHSAHSLLQLRLCRICKNCNTTA